MPGNRQSSVVVEEPGLRVPALGRWLDHNLLDEHPHGDDRWVPIWN